MASFDADAIAAAMERPEVTVERRYWWERPLVWAGLLPRTVTIRGRLLSHWSWLPLEARFKQAQEMDERSLLRLYQDFFRAIGINDRRLRHLPAGVVLEMVTRFLSLQRRAGLLSPETATELGLMASGTPSPPAGASPNGTRRKLEDATMT